MQKQLNQVIEFHKAFNRMYRMEFSNQPLPNEVIKLRGSLMREEVEEWIKDAIINNNKASRAKELVDILYVVFGTIITEGLQDQIELVFDEVHKSNMSKLLPDGTFMEREDGKIIKPSNYQPPNLDFL